MAFAKKRSRNIIVDNIEYRWKIKRKYKSADDSLVVLIDKVEDGKTILLVDTGFLRPDGGFSKIGNRIQGIVTPKMIEAYIRNAYSNGWKPNLNGSMFVL